MSDHLSGTRAVADPAIDLTDLYAFPSPSRPGRLVLVLDVFPSAWPGALFSDAASYRFRVRPVSVPMGHSGALFDVGADEFALTCTFSAPAGPDEDGRSAQRGTCVLPSGASVSFLVNDERGGEGDDVRCYAGLRLDPFFMDVAKEVETRASGRLAFVPQGTNPLEGNDVLTFVAELDAARVFGPAAGSVFAVAAETVTLGPYPVRLERLGRPEVKNILMSENGVDTANKIVDLRDLYNEEDPFRLGPTYLDAYRSRLNANLGFFDGLDGKLDWTAQPDGTHPLTELLLADFLVVDAAKPYAEDSYFEIEWALLEGREYTTCGGRSLNDDVIDTLYTLIVNAGHGPRVSDGVDGTVPALREFPYLAPANPYPPEQAATIPKAPANR
ncbi:DUF4331 domain-containing protein [Streptomyces broussonetiae]|uniref:DUF4331 domain-containing protein n=1 Tax=Streptomyces broussonetiae TaxID=2686304 RepID=A0A6I6N2M0_9ACTN|nr:DUF4331 family protein [Streptomyces broussonetiae]QHA04691.1 DUF4331 domain-containing protein [Streptomyces broussonetiae]